MTASVELEKITGRESQGACRQGGELIEVTPIGEDTRQREDRSE
jgi:hypothetical protein